MTNNIKNIIINDYQFQTDFIYLEDIRKMINLDAVSVGFSEEIASNIAMAVDEACTNLIRYSFNLDPNNQILIETQFDSKCFTIRIKDNGKPFNPTEVNEPDMIDYFKSFKRGGLGIHIMKKFMDEIIYTPSNSKNSMNTLTLVKSLHILN
jgi:serine/threonine-protein kinase RsbW